MFLNHFKSFYPGVGRDRLIEVAAHFRIVASLGYLLADRSVKRNQESLLRSRQIAKSLIDRECCPQGDGFSPPIHSLSEVARAADMPVKLFRTKPPVSLCKMLKPEMPPDSRPTTAILIPSNSSQVCS
jgi:hypothetical protein